MPHPAWRALRPAKLEIFLSLSQTHVVGGDYPEDPKELRCQVDNSIARSSSSDACKRELLPKPDILGVDILRCLCEIAGVSDLLAATFTVSTGSPRPFAASKVPRKSWLPIFCSKSSAKGTGHTQNKENQTSAKPRPDACNVSGRQACAFIISSPVPEMQGYVWSTAIAASLDLENK